MAPVDSYPAVIQKGFFQETDKNKIALTKHEKLPISKVGFYFLGK